MQKLIKRQVNAARSRAMQQAGFSMLELLVVSAMIVVLSGMAAIGIEPVLANNRANKAMYQVVESLRNARMLAMSQNTKVSVQFTADNAIMMQLWNNDSGKYEDIVNTGVVLDPSTRLENGYQFTRSGLSNVGMPDNFNNGADYPGDIVFDKTPVVPANPPSRRFVFTADGFLIEDIDTYQPINGTIFIGLPDGSKNLSRAVTVMGATGRISVWRWKDGWRSGR